MRIKQQLRDRLEDYYAHKIVENYDMDETDIELYIAM